MTSTIADFNRRMRAREISAAEMTEECLKRIREENERLNAFILVMANEARNQAREADRELAAGRDRGVLHGVPVSIKDIFDVRGTPTTAASRVRDGHLAERDAPVVANLRRAGAVIIGKTNLHEFAFGTTNEDSAFGPTRNPHDTSRSSGGSSGGSAVSVSAGMALASLGTDTGGSIRIPAAACGIVGLKPTYGELSTEGVVPLSKTFDHVGPLASSVNDAWFVLRVLAGDYRPRPLDPAPASLLKLGVPRPYFCDVLDDEVRSKFEAALEQLRSAGVEVKDAPIGHASLTAPVYTHISFGDIAAYHGRTLETMADRYTKPVRLRLETARYVMAEDYSRALTGREVLQREVDTLLTEYDALVLPALPIPAPPLGTDSIAIGGTQYLVRALMLRLTQLFNLTGHPAVSIPCGSTAAGLPCGLQLVGIQAQTEYLLRVALAVEQRLKV